MPLPKPPVGGVTPSGKDATRGKRQPPTSAVDAPGRPRPPGGPQRPAPAKRGR
jgi:hypothetical protein